MPCAFEFDNLQLIEVTKNFHHSDGAPISFLLPREPENGSAFKSPKRGLDQTLKFFIFSRNFLKEAKPLLSGNIPDRDSARTGIVYLQCDCLN